MEGIVKARDLPEGLRLLALMEQQASGNEPNENINLTLTSYNGNFHWHSTQNGYHFWRIICRFYSTSFFVDQVTVSHPPSTWQERLGDWNIKISDIIK